jgi:DNA repair protein RecO (recombination protein O)
MPSFVVTPAVVLRSRPYGESDKIVSFFTELHGKVTGIAKGAKRSRRRFANSLEPFSLVSLRFQERANASLAFINACDLIRVFKSLTAHLDRIAHASYFMEITDGLVGERDENRAIFTHLTNGLSRLDEHGSSLLSLIFFELKLLALAGYQPHLGQCRRCGTGWREHHGSTKPVLSPSTSLRIDSVEGLTTKGGAWRFSLRDGGILCEGCAAFRKEVLPLSREALGVVTTLQQTGGVPPNGDAFPIEVLGESHLALLRFLQFQIGKELKSAPFLEAYLLP